MKKKMLSVLLCMGLLAGGLTGCGSKDQGNEGSSGSGSTKPEQSSAASGEEITFPLSKPVTMSMSVYQVAGSDVTKTLTLTEMEKKTNVKWDYYPLGEDSKDKLPLEFGAEEYKDVYLRSGLSQMDIDKYAREGIIIPLNDLIDQYMPNLKARLDERDLWGYITSDDGNIYSLPQIGELTVGMLMFANKPWMDKLGIEEPKTVDEFLDMLRRFKNEDPNGNGKKDEIPLVLCKDMLNFLPQYFGVTYDALSGSMAMYEDGKVAYYPSSDKYKEYLRILRVMAEEGLINADYEAITWQDQEAVTMTGDTAGAFIHWGGYLGVGPDRDEDFPALTPMAESKMIVTSGYEAGGMVITDKCKTPELAAKWADTFYSDEGSMLAWMGVEGESYDLGADGTYSWKTDGSWGDNQTAILTNATLMGHKPISVYVPAIYNAGNQNPDEIFLQKHRKIAVEHGVETFPILSWTESESTERVTYLADILPYVDQYRAAVVTGQQDLDGTWEDYVKKLDQMQLQRLAEIDQAAYDRFLSKVK